MGETDNDKEKIGRVYRSSIPIPVTNENAKKAKTDWENTTKFEILEDVPLPWTRVSPREIIFPFEGMAIGRSFQFMRETDRGQNTYSATVSYCNQPENFHKKFIVRKISTEMISGVEWTKWGCWREDDLTQKQIEKKRNRIDIKQRIASQKRRDKVGGR